MCSLVAVKAPTAAESAALNIGFDDALEFAVIGGAKLATGQDVYTGFQILQSTNPNSATPTKTVSQKFSSRPVRAVAGLLIGLLLGILVALARGLLDKRVSSAKRAQAALGYPVVAELPAESSDSSEAYRMLWLSVFREPLPEAMDQGDQWLEGADLRLDSGYLARVGTMRSAVRQALPVPSLDLTPARHAARSVVMVTSPGAEPSRAAVAVNLATVCAEIGQRVVIVTTEGIGALVDGLEPPM